MASEKEADGLKFIKTPKAPQSRLYFPQTVSKNLCSTSYTECLKLIHIENLLHSGTILGSFYTHSQHQHQPWDLGWATQDMNPYPLEGQRTMKEKGMPGTN